MTKQNHHDEEQDDEALPCHTVHMRQVLFQCQAMMEEALPMLKPGTWKGPPPWKARKQALKWFETEHLPFNTIPVVDVNDMTPLGFRQRFHRGNIPCLIRGLSQEFLKLTNEWKCRDGTINKDWFVKMIGKDTMVPVRKQTMGAIDQDGRAEECETVEVAIMEWTQSQSEPHLYLKDWHLVKELEKRESYVYLYSVPEIFEHDILNAFLTRFTDGDYRFVYWGGAQSKTPIHSDVLNSFSWSYNVVGLKEWRFHVPESNASVVIRQDAGECLFVPAGWQHEVTNLVETLSVNHNWVTASNIDLLWECVLMELKTVEKECCDWGLSNDNFGPRESMLRGCSGLDVSGCFFLLLYSLLDSLLRCAAEDDGDVALDLQRLLEAVNSLLQNERLAIQHRLAAVLASENLADASLLLAKQLMAALNFCHR
jgi:hypothetical protein